MIYEVWLMDPQCDWLWQYITWSHIKFPTIVPKLHFIKIGVIFVSSGNLITRKINLYENTQVWLYAKHFQLHFFLLRKYIMELPLRSIYFSVFDFFGNFAVFDLFKKSVFFKFNLLMLIKVITNSNFIWNFV